MSWEGSHPVDPSGGDHTLESSNSPLLGSPAQPTVSGSKGTPPGPKKLSQTSAIQRSR